MDYSYQLHRPLVAVQCIIVSEITTSTGVTNSNSHGWHRCVVDATRSLSHVVRRSRQKWPTRLQPVWLLLFLIVPFKPCIGCFASISSGASYYRVCNQRVSTNRRRIASTKSTAKREARAGGSALNSNFYNVNGYDSDKHNHNNRSLSSTLVSSATSAMNPSARSPLPTMTVILPAYNEEQRITQTLRLYHDYLSASPLWPDSTNLRLLVVDDGSTDSTVKVVSLLATETYYANSGITIETISLEINQGKGAAVEAGVQHVVHCQTMDAPVLVLVADADGSADIGCLPNMLYKIQSMVTNVSSTNSNVWYTPAVVVGLRKENDRSFQRTILRWGFRVAVRIICGDLGVQDTQCGFKLMTLSAGQFLYRDLHLQGWSHDVEVLYRARQLHILVGEESVMWEDKAGSKLVTSAGGTVGASLRMLVEVLLLRIMYTLGQWG